MRTPTVTFSHVRRVLTFAVIAGMILVTAWPGGPHGVRAASGTSAWLTYHLDNARDGADTGEQAFTSVARSWSVASPITGDQVYAEPLVFNGVVYAVTQADNVYAMDEFTGRMLWRLNLGTPVSAGTLPCGNIQPTVGILSTPVIDSATNTLYALAYNSLLFKVTQHRLYAIDLTSHTVSWSVGADPFPLLTKVEQQRGALALGNGSVYVAYGGQSGDCGNYHGLLAAISTTTHQMSAFREAASRNSDHGAAIWGASGPAVDSSGNVYVTTGNGTSEDGYDYSETVAKLSPGLVPLASWAPSNWLELDDSDTDLGSVGPLLLGNGIVFQSGKQGMGYLLSLSALNQIGGALFEQQISSLTEDACFGGDAFDGTNIYIACADGIYALRFDAVTPSFAIAWHFGSATFMPPIVAGGAVWTISGTSLYALDPATGAPVVAPVTLHSTTQHFATPSASDGMIFVPETTSIEAFRLQ